MNLRESIYHLAMERSDNTTIQFIRYIFVGGIATFFDITILFIFYKIFNVNYLIAAAVGFIFGLTVNYFLSIFMDISEFRQDR